MIPIVIMAIEDESDRDYITGLFLKNERSMYAMALKIVKEHHTACDMPENDLEYRLSAGHLRAEADAVHPLHCQEYFAHVSASAAQ